MYRVLTHQSSDEEYVLKYPNTHVSTHPLVVSDSSLTASENDMVQVQNAPEDEAGPVPTVRLVDL